MINYLCVGVGVFLAIYVVNLANPANDLGFWEGIIAFLTTLFGWPICLIGNLIRALEHRKETIEVNKIAEELMSEFNKPGVWEEMFNKAEKMDKEAQKLYPEEDNDEEQK